VFGAVETRIPGVADVASGEADPKGHNRENRSIVMFFVAVTDTLVLAVIVRAIGRHAVDRVGIITEPRGHG
jgi:hypothetical protein